MRLREGTLDCVFLGLEGWCGVLGCWCGALVRVCGCWFASMTATDQYLFPMVRGSFARISARSIVAAPPGPATGIAR